MSAHRLGLFDYPVIPPLTAPFANRRPDIAWIPQSTSRNQNIPFAFPFASVPSQRRAATWNAADGPAGTLEGVAGYHGPYP